MSWTSIAGRGGANNKTSGTTLSGSPSGTVVAGRILFVAVATDNIDTSDGQTTLHAISDSLGNVYTKAREQTNGEGTAAAGITTSLWGTQTAADLTTSDSITLTCSSAVVAKAICFYETSVAGGMTFTFQSATGGVADAATNGPSMILSGLASQEWLFLANSALEGPNTDAFTDDVDYVSAASRGMSAGVADTNATIFLRRRIVTATGDTYQASNSIARDWAGVFVAVGETAIPAAGPSQGPAYAGGGYYG